MAKYGCPYCSHTNEGDLAEMKGHIAKEHPFGTGHMGPERRFGTGAGRRHGVPDRRQNVDTGALDRRGPHQARASWLIERRQRVRRADPGTAGTNPFTGDRRQQDRRSK